MCATTRYSASLTRLLSQYRMSSFLRPPVWCEFHVTRKDYICIGLTRAAFKPTSLCSLWLLSDTIVDCVVRSSIVSSPALCRGFVMNRKEFNLCQFPAIVPRHVATKYESILTPARSCRKQEPQPSSLMISGRLFLEGNILSNCKLYIFLAKRGSIHGNEHPTSCVQIITVSTVGGSKFKGHILQNSFL
jgi:hypothetical protein